MGLLIVPCSLREANAFVTAQHRHHGPTRGHKLSVAVVDEARMRGVAIIGRPVAKSIDDGRSIEVLRLCTDGVRNGCSVLYGACRRVAIEQGYLRGITYILDSEHGRSLKASGYRWLWNTDGGSWDRPARRRSDKAPLVPKQAWGWGDWGHVHAYRKAHPEEFAA